MKVDKLLVVAVLMGACAPVDEDGDGFTIEDGDCDDTDVNAFPRAVEVCDGVDQDCNGSVDDDASDVVTFYRDADGDSYGNEDDTEVACSAPAGFVDRGGDCNDENAEANPEGADVVGEDLDCSGKVWYTGPVVVESLDIDCPGPPTVTFTAETVGLTSGAVLVIFETKDVAGTHWVEEHDLESVDADAKGGFYDTLERSMLMGQYPVERNVGTYWSCAVYEYLSFAVVAYDAEGNPADCLATGRDPQGMIDGDYEPKTPPEVDLSGCRVEKATK